MPNRFSERITSRIINCKHNLLDAIKQMDKIDCKLLLVFNNDEFVSIISIGDIQRALIKGIKLDEPITKVLRKTIKVGLKDDSTEVIKELIQKYRMEFLPIIDDNNILINVVFWEDIFNEVQNNHSEKIDTPVVIMAGGRGVRLKPITNIIPKPLIPLGDKPIIEWIVDTFTEIGVKSFFFSVNYKKEMIKRYFDDINDKKYEIHYFSEDEPLGTAGSLQLLKDKIRETFFVTNCDILIKEDYSEILNYHKENNNELTVVAVIKHFNIPYGTIEFAEEGILKSISEKPDLNFFINAGMYILEPHLLNEIPEKEFYHITELMDKLKRENRRVGVFPVSEGSWMDIGQWDEYNKTSKKLGFKEDNL